MDQQIEKAKRGDTKAQRYLYDLYAPIILGVCRRYISDLYTAEDIMIQSFVKIFRALDTYERRGSFDAWISKIASFECISFLRAEKKNHIFISLENPEYNVQDTYVDLDMDEDQLQWLIDQLPEGCKMVFIMSVIDGYKHGEIADMLNISEGTSKSQLAYARKIMKSHLRSQKII